MAKQPIEAGDVVTVDFPGATGMKRRPAIVLPSDVYHRERPDVVLGVVTSNVASAGTTTDHVLQDWQSAGLRLPSAFRSYYGMALAKDLRPVGHLSARDWDAIRRCLSQALA